MPETGQADFADRLVVVTGGTGALGSAVVHRVLMAGGRVVVPVFNSSELKGFEHAGHERLTIVEDVDLCDESSAETFYASLDGPLWASIHTAGGFAMAPLDEADAGHMLKMLRLNTLTCYNACRAAVRVMRGGGSGGGSEGGRLVNVTARGALFPELGGGMVPYVTSKAAVAAITQALGAELTGDGIWVNAVAPSTIDTPANREAMPDADPDIWPTPAEIAETIAFLASPLNQTTRSAIVPVYGQS